jgi:hypothetical protein
VASTAVYTNNQNASLWRRAMLWVAAAPLGVYVHACLWSVFYLAGDVDEVAAKPVLFRVLGSSCSFSLELQHGELLNAHGT